MSKNRAERRALILPQGQRAYSRVPSEVRPLINGAAESAKNQPWFFAYRIMRDFGEMSDQATPEISPMENPVFRLMTTALLEKMGTSPKHCTDPFQAAVYGNSARRDFLKASKRYIKEHGGELSVREQMQKWIDENKDLIAAMPFPQKSVGGSIPPRDGPPPTLKQYLNEWIDRLREQFEERQEADPIVAGLLPDGSQRFLTRSGFTNPGQREPFFQLAHSQLAQKGAQMTVQIMEAWASPNLDMPASQSEQRQECVIVIAEDEANRIHAMIPIERDWETGTATLGETEY